MEKERTSKKMFHIPNKSRITRRDSREDTRSFLGLGDETKWYGTLTYTSDRKWDSTSTEMVERFKETGHSVFKSISDLSRRILKRRNGRDTIHFDADASNTTLVSHISLSKSAQYPRSSLKLV